MSKQSNKNSKTQSEERSTAAKVVHQRNDLLIAEGNIYTQPNNIEQSKREGLESAKDRIREVKSKPRPQTQSINSQNPRDSKIVRSKFIFWIKSLVLNIRSN